MKINEPERVMMRGKTRTIGSPRRPQEQAGTAAERPLPQGQRRIGSEPRAQLSGDKNAPRAVVQPRRANELGRFDPSPRRMPVEGAAAAGEVPEGERKGNRFPERIAALEAFRAELETVLAEYAGRVGQLEAQAAGVIDQLVVLNAGLADERGELAAHQEAAAKEAPTKPEGAEAPPADEHE